MPPPSPPKPRPARRRAGLPTFRHAHPERRRPGHPERRRTYDYRTHAAGAGTDTFTWKLHIPADGNYAVYVKYPVVTGAATNASISARDSQL